MTRRSGQAALPRLPVGPGRPGMSRRARAHVSVALALTIVAIGAAAVLLAVFPPNDQSLLRAGAPAPDFTLHSAAGAVTSLPDLRGSPVLLEFCATWSSPCTIEARTLDRLAAQAPARAAVVSIDGDSENAASVASFVRFNHVRFPVLLDPGARTVSFPAHGPRGPVTGRYRVTEFPTFYVLDGRGNVAWTAVGSQPEALLARELRLAARSVP